MIKSKRFTSKYHNQSKFDTLNLLNNKVLELKNQMSDFIFNNLNLLITDKKSLIKDYKLFKIDNLSSWETQSLFQDIAILYENNILKYKQNLSLKIQKSIKKQYYKKNTKSKSKGDLKSYSIQFKQTNLSKLIKYMIFVDKNNLDNIMIKSKLKDIFNYYKNKPYWNRILDFVELIKSNLINKIKRINFNTGTYRKSPSENGTSKSSYFYKDESNSKYKHWFAYKIGKEYIHLPIQINANYCTFEKLRKSEYYVKINKNKIDIISTIESKEPKFKNKQNVEGMDLNIKHNFCQLSNGKQFDYDRKYVKQMVDLLKKLDKIGTKNLNDQNKKKIQKITRRNEWYFKKLISEILDYFEDNKITDVVMEDLGQFGKTFIKHPDFDIKYSKLVRLLRLSNIKIWFNEQAEKRGIRVHISKPHYSSQQCNKCGCISKNNRKIQEVFRCIDCGYEENADVNSAINLRRRYNSDVLNKRLHSKDKYNRLIPKMMRKNSIKQVLYESFE